MPKTPEFNELANELERIAGMIGPGPENETWAASAEDVAMIRKAARLLRGSSPKVTPEMKAGLGWKGTK